LLPPSGLSPYVSLSMWLYRRTISATVSLTILFKRVNQFLFSFRTRHHINMHKLLYLNIPPDRMNWNQHSYTLLSSYFLATSQIASSVSSPATQSCWNSCLTITGNIAV
jgi:hypothetical protein